MHISYITEFLMLAESESFVDAAEKLYTTQSTLSKHIRRMEQELGIVLFDRSSRHVRLSECGALFMPYARAIAEQEQKYTQALSEHSQMFGNTIRVGTVNNITAYNISNVIVSFQHDYPNYEVRILADSPYEVYQWLLDDRIDLAFLRYTDKTDLSAFSVIPFAEEEMVVACSNNHRLAARKVVSMEELRDEKFLLYAPQSFMYNCVMDACDRAGFRPNVALAVPRTENLIELTAQEMGMGFFMKRHALRYANPGVATISIDPPYKSRIDVCYKKSKKPTAAIKTFLRFVAQWKKPPTEA